MRHMYLTHISAMFLGLLYTISVAASSEAQIVKQIPGVERVNAEQLIDLAAATPELLIIDSRIANDRVHGYIEGSVSLPDTETDCDALAGVISGKQHPTLSYCNGPTCGRSARAVKIARQCGYTDLYWFFGGFEEWQAKKYPYIK